MKYKAICAVCMLATFFISGCWDRVELNDIALVTGFAVEKGEEKKYKITVEVINAQELAGKKASGNAPAVVFSREGDSLSELTHAMNVGLTRKLVFSHVRIVVIDEGLARSGLLDFIDYMERDRQMRDDFKILVTRHAAASDVLKITYPLQKVPSLKVSDQIDTMVNEWGGDPHVRMKDFVDALTSPGRQPVAEAVTISGDPKKGNNADNNKKLKMDTITTLAGMGVFKNTKLLGFLSIVDTRNFEWIENLLKQTSVTIPIQKGKAFGIRIIHTGTHIKAKYSNGTPTITINVVSEGRIDGVQTGWDLSSIQTYQKLEQLTGAYIEKRLSHTIHIVQKKYKVDIFGFGEHMNRQDYQHFKEVKSSWDKEFTNANVEVHCTIRLRRSGIRDKTFLGEIQ